MSTFRKATRATARARVAFEGPSGAGKTWTALQWATVLGGPVALVDTERGSASLYAKHFDFDVLELTPPYHPDRLIAALKEADNDGYQVVVIDSLSHFWSGEGGVLDIVDEIAARSASRNSFSAWKEGSPLWKGLIDSILALDAHAIITMRSKTEYVIEQNAKGKNEPRKVGLAPEARAGVEFEFTMVGSLEPVTHRLSFSKSRCDTLADKVFTGGKAVEAADIFKAWLSDGEPLAGRNAVDALVQRMNGIADIDARRACKQQFLDTFGRPEALIAARLDEAQRFVESYHNPSPPSGDATPSRTDDGEGPDGVGDDSTLDGRDPAQPEGPSKPSGSLEADHDARVSSQSGPGRSHASLASCPCGWTSDSFPTRAAAEQAAKRHNSQDRAADPGFVRGGNHAKDPLDPHRFHARAAAMGIDEDERRAMIGQVTDGRTTSASDCTLTERQELKNRLDMIGTAQPVQATLGDAS